MRAVAAHSIPQVQRYISTPTAYYLERGGGTSSSFVFRFALCERKNETHINGKYHAAAGWKAFKYRTASLVSFTKRT
jgi:hypothetical protein